MKKISLKVSYEIFYFMLLKVIRFNTKYTTVAMQVFTKKPIVYTTQQHFSIDNSYLRLQNKESLILLVFIAQ